MSDYAELRRLLAESARPGEVFQVAYGHHYDYAVHDRAGWTVAECAGENWVRLIAAAVNALPGLLDALEKAEAHRDSLAATLIEVQREKWAAEGAIEILNDHRCTASAERAYARTIGAENERARLAAQIERVRELHAPGEEWCGYHNSALCECADVHCDECGNGWPCPTVQALDGGE